MLGFLGYYVWQRRRGYRPGPRRAAGIARVVGYGLVVGTVVGGLSLRSAMADVGEASQALGHELLPLSDVLGARTHILLNGESVFVGNALTDEPVSTVLDRFQQSCHENRATSSEVWAKVADLKEKFGKATPEQLATAPRGAELKAALGRLAAMPIDKFGTIRTGGGDSGVVICFTQADGSPVDGVTAWTEFRKTGELSKVGNLRYAYATRTKQSTHVLTAWTQDKFNLTNFSGGVGSGAAGQDAPGQDPAGIPRPPQARRVVTASVEGTPYGMHVYESSSSPAEIIAFYDTKMTADGWTTLRPIGADREIQRGYQKGVIEIAVLTKKMEKVTQVMLGELGRE
jgi:hypothetical protein